MITSKEFIDGPPVSKKSKCRYCEMGDKRFKKGFSSRSIGIGFVGMKDGDMAYFHSLKMEQSGIIYDLLCMNQNKK